MSSWVLVDVGCIECGMDTHIVGVYPTQEETRAALVAECERVGTTMPDKSADCVGYFSGGQRSLEIHEAPESPHERDNQEAS